MKTKIKVNCIWVPVKVVDIQIIILLMQS